jgi:HD-GYP domain-containing protein (c-di-GMP phosphodiesterase class II)
LLLGLLGLLGLALALRQMHLAAQRQLAQQHQQLRTEYGQLEAAYHGSLRTLSAALDSRDNETSGHTERVSRYALCLGQELGLSRQELDHLYTGALLHDLGKMGVPDRILRKPGKLDERELHLMRAHVNIGDVIIRELPHLAGARAVVLNHHERWDGMGYPQGLSGSTIPLAARIFALCDAYDAMTTDRPYARKRSDAAARAEIQSQSGKQFDPKVVEAFMRIPADDWVILAMEPTSRAKEEIRQLIEAAAAV